MFFHSKWIKKRKFALSKLSDVRQTEHNANSRREANALGVLGEQMAARYLEDNGYMIVERNFRAGKHEIDILALKDGQLVVVEVKTRSDDELVAPEEAVDHKKRQSLIWAANDYVLRHNRQEPVRFDIITLVKTGEDTELHHIEDAFNVFCY